MIMSLVILAVGSQHLPENNEGFDEPGSIGTQIRATAIMMATTGNQRGGRT